MTTSKNGSRPTRPHQPPPPAEGDLPPGLVQRPQWVLWRWTWNARKRAWDKPPIDPATGKPTDATNRDAWLSFDQAAEIARREGWSVGFAVEGSGLVGVDLDKCLDDAGDLADWAWSIVRRLRSYTERTPSGRGLRVWVRGTLPPGRRRQGGIEFYDSGRYFTVTGWHFDDSPNAIAERTAELADLHAELFPPARKAEKRTAPALDLDDEEIVAKARRARDGAKFAALFDSDDAAGYPSESEADLALCSKLAFWTGGDADRIERIVNGSTRGQRGKWRDRPDYRERTIAKALQRNGDAYSGRQAKPSANGNGHVKTPAVAEADDGGKRPEIEVTTEWHTTVDQAVDALRMDPDLYRRGDVLVTVAAETEAEVALTPRSILRNAAGSPKVIRLSPAMIGCHLTRVATLYQWRKDRSGEDVSVNVRPPDWLLSALATRGHYPGIRPLLAVVECPYVRDDGTVAETPGYDPETGTLYRPAIRFPAVASRPTQADARAAAERLRELVKQFPFASSADFAAWLAGLLTAVNRPAIRGPVPGIAINGNAAGVGKGLLVDLVGIVATGRGVPATGYPDDKQEAQKVKVAIALDTRPIVHFDNLDDGSTYGNSALDSALTSTVIDDRILGQSRSTGPVPLAVTWFLSGNRLAPGKDAYRRWLPVNLDTPLEHPEEREDLEIPDLRAHATEHRGELVKACLTILRAHALAGRPAASKAPLGSFEVWDRIIRGAVAFATGIDPCLTRRAAAEEAPERLRKLALVEGWREMPDGGDGGKGVTAETARKLAEDHPDQYPGLRSALLDMSRDGSLPSKRTIGNRLRALSGVTLNGIRLEKAGEDRHRNALWRAVKVNPDHPKGGATAESDESDESRSHPYARVPDDSIRVNGSAENGRDDGNQSRQTRQTRHPSVMIDDPDDPVFGGL